MQDDKFLIIPYIEIDGIKNNPRDELDKITGKEQKSIRCWMPNIINNDINAHRK